MNDLMDRPSRMAEIVKDCEHHRQLIGCCMLPVHQGGGEYIEKCVNGGITIEHFNDQSHKLVFAEMVAIYKERGKNEYDADPSELMLRLNRKGLKNEVEWGPILEAQESIVGRVVFSSAFDSVREIASSRSIRRLAMEIKEGVERGADESELRLKIKQITDASSGGGPRRFPRIPLGEFCVLPDDDDTVLLGDGRYICRGAICATVSTSGMGKSSMSIQEAMLYALGRPFFGIKPNGPLRSLVMQSEDDAGDIGEIVESVTAGLELTKEEMQIVSNNVHIVSDKISRGEAFITQLMEHASEFQPDLVWINPLQAFFKGDLTSGEDLGNFIREQLGWANREDKWAYMLIHHTTKPSKEKVDVKWNEAMYNMAGGAELINPCRAIRILEASDVEGEFVLNLAKRGRRAGVKECKTTDEGTENPLQVETVTKIYLKHSDRKFKPRNKDREIPMIFWESREKRYDEGKSANAKYTEDELRIVGAHLSALGGSVASGLLSRSLNDVHEHRFCEKIVKLVTADPMSPIMTDSTGIRFRGGQRDVERFRDPELEKLLRRKREEDERGPVVATPKPEEPEEDAGVDI